MVDRSNEKNSRSSQNHTHSVTRVLAIDDHPIVRRGIAAALEDQPDLVLAAEAADPDEAAGRVESGEIDLVLLELALPNTDGLEWLKNMAARVDDLAVVVFSVLDENLYAQRALQAGARGYVMKSQDLDVLVDTIRRVRSGRVGVSQAMSERLLEQMATSGQDPEGVAPIDRLSDRELEVFRAIGQGNGTRGIAEDLGLSPKTIETYRENIKAKLDLADANALVHSAVRWVAEQV